MIDAHHHYWDPARGDYDWLTPGSPLDRMFGPADLEPLLEQAGLGGTVLVQAAPTLAETDWLLDLRARSRTVLGVIGWIDLDDPGIVDRLADRVSRGLVGIRPMLQDLPDPAWILSDERMNSLRAVTEVGLVFDALVRPPGLSAVATLAQLHPELTIVLDHAGKPPVGTPAMTDWWHDLGLLAAQPNCWCKLSGIMTEAPRGTSQATIIDLVRRIADLWGPDRLIWGSDWPVLTLAADYGTWLAAVQQALAHWTEEERNAVFGGNAMRVYGV